MPTQKAVDKIINEIDLAVSSFNDSIPGIQKQLFDDIQTLLKELDTDAGKLKNTVANLKLLGRLKNKIDSLILNPDYKKKVAEFAKSFNAISNLHNQYFSTIVNKFTVPDVLDAIKIETVKSTVVSLTEAGISANVSEGITDLLRTNITTGGKYFDLVDQMRNFIISNDKGIGALERYTRQITTDSLNQYSANYNQTISAGLGFKWFRYTGSNLTTTRAFCEAMSKKEFYHITELPQILHGHIDGETIPINKKTGVWAGGIPGTTVENFQTNRGGYNCGHQVFGCSDAMVPESLKAKY